jgi:hypothetical protein
MLQRFVASAAVVAGLVPAVVGAGAASASAPTAHAARTCHLSVSQQRNSGATYLVQLTATSVSCTTALKVEKSWQACRRATSGRTTCRRRVAGYSSKQAILDSSKHQYDARVVAKSGQRTVTFIYTQDK